MRIRYALALPLLHLAIAAPPMIHQQSEGWRYIPIEQAVEDIDRERTEPARDAMLWSPCYEYRLPSAGPLILTAHFPSGTINRFVGGRVCTWRNTSGPESAEVLLACENARRDYRLPVSSWNLRAVVAGWRLARSAIQAIEAHAPVGCADRNYYCRRDSHGSDGLRTARLGRAGKHTYGSDHASGVDSSDRYVRRSRRSMCDQEKAPSSSSNFEGLFFVSRVCCEMCFLNRQQNLAPFAPPTLALLPPTPPPRLYTSANKSAP